MKSFSSGARRVRDEIVAELNEAAEAMDAEYGAVEAAIGAFNAKIDAYNEVVEKAREFVTDMVSKLGQYMGEKSDKWLEGDRGQEYEAWKSALEDKSFDDIEAIEMPDKPEPDHSATLEGLQEEIGA